MGAGANPATGVRRAYRRGKREGVRNLPLSLFWNGETSAVMRKCRQKERRRLYREGRPENHRRLQPVGENRREGSRG